jgi:hypothetical protein
MRKTHYYKSYNKHKQTKKQYGKGYPNNNQANNQTNKRDYVNALNHIITNSNVAEDEHALFINLINDYLAIYSTIAWKLDKQYENLIYDNESEIELKKQYYKCSYLRFKQDECNAQSECTYYKSKCKSKESQHKFNVNCIVKAHDYNQYKLLNIIEAETLKIKLIDNTEIIIKALIYKKQIPLEPIHDMTDVVFVLCPYKQPNFPELSSFRKKIIDAIKINIRNSEITENTIICCAGHSMGGGVAQAIVYDLLESEDINDKYKKNIRMVLTGSDIYIPGVSDDKHIEYNYDKIKKRIDNFKKQMKGKYISLLLRKQAYSRNSNININGDVNDIHAFFILNTHDNCYTLYKYIKMYNLNANNNNNNKNIIANTLLNIIFIGIKHETNTLHYTLVYDEFTDKFKNILSSRFTELKAKNNNNKQITSLKKIYEYFHNIEDGKFENITLMGLLNAYKEYNDSLIKYHNKYLSILYDDTINVKTLDKTVIYLKLDKMWNIKYIKSDSKFSDNFKLYTGYDIYKRVKTYNYNDNEPQSILTNEHNIFMKYHDYKYNSLTTLHMFDKYREYLTAMNILNFTQK